MKYEYMTSRIGAEAKDPLNRLGAQRWRLVIIDNGIFYFIREVPETGVVFQTERVRATS